jgi:hypothetical protein
LIGYGDDSFRVHCYLFGITPLGGAPRHALADGWTAHPFTYARYGSGPLDSCDKWRFASIAGALAFVDVSKVDADCVRRDDDLPRPCLRPGTLL